MKIINNWFKCILKGKIKIASYLKSKHEDDNRKFLNEQNRDNKATFIDFNNMNTIQIKQLFNNLKKTPGYCVFIDICNSTQLKDTEIHKWIIRIKNTFSWAQSFFPFKVLKGIGDELMFYIPEEKLNWLKDNKPVSYFSPSQMLQALHEFAKNKDYQEPVKIAICYCEDVYHITFIENVDDYYGKDIDLAARLMRDSSKNSIIMNKKFFEIIKSEHENLSWGSALKDMFEEIKMLPPKNYKGFKERVEHYQLECT